MVWTVGAGSPQLSAVQCAQWRQWFLWAPPLALVSDAGPTSHTGGPCAAVCAGGMAGQKQSAADADAVEDICSQVSLCKYG